MSRLRTSHMNGIRRALIGGNRITARSCSRTSAATTPGETVFVLGAGTSSNARLDKKDIAKKNYQKLFSFPRGLKG